VERGRQLVDDGKLLTSKPRNALPNILPCVSEA
jgi:hypothetical protein